MCLYFIDKSKTFKGTWCKNDVQIIWYLDFGRDIQAFLLPRSIGELMSSAKLSLCSDYANIFLNSEETRLNLSCAFPLFVWNEAEVFFWFRDSSEYVVVGHNLYRTRPLKKCLGSLLMMDVLLPRLSSVSG